MNAFATKILICITCVTIIYLCWLLLHKQIKEMYTARDPVLTNLRTKFNDFFNTDIKWEYPLDMLNHRNVMNEISLHRGDKSYTINKENIYICLKDENGQYYDENMLIYVLAHETSHVLCDEIGHTEKFHIIFDALLDKLSQAEIYNPSIPIKTDYCQNGDHSF